MPLYQSLHSLTMTGNDSSLAIRVARECIPGLVWTTEDSKGTYWHGNGMLVLSEMQKILPLKYQFLTDFPESDNGEVHYIATGKLLVNLPC